MSISFVCFTLAIFAINGLAHVIHPNSKAFPHRDLSNAPRSQFVDQSNVPGNRFGDQSNAPGGRFGDQSNVLGRPFQDQSSAPGSRFGDQSNAPENQFGGDEDDLEVIAVERVRYSICCHLPIIFSS